MQHSIPLSHPEAIRAFLHAKIRPFPQTYSLKNSFQYHRTNLHKICIYYPKSSKFGKLGSTSLTPQRDLSNQSLQKFRKVVKAQKLLSKIFSSFESLHSLEKGKSWLLPVIKYLQSFSSLILDCSSLLSLKPLKFLFMKLAALKKFKKLKISLQGIKDSNISPIFMKFLQRIKTLVDLSVSWKFNSYRTEFLSHLKKLTQLRILRLKIFETGKLENYIRCLASILPNLALLTKISLSFPDFIIIQDSSLHQLFTSLQSLKALLSLKLNYCLQVP